MPRIQDTQRQCGLTVRSVPNDWCDRDYTAALVEAFRMVAMWSQQLIKVMSSFLLPHERLSDHSR